MIDKWGNAKMSIAPVKLRIQVLNPPHCRHIRYFSQIALCRGQMSVPQDDLADNLNWRSGPGSVSGGMASEIMRPQIHPHHSSNFVDHQSGGIVRDRKNSPLRLDTLILDLFPLRGLVVRKIISSIRSFSMIFYC
jgi:hypothetical protein